MIVALEWVAVAALAVAWWRWTDWTLAETFWIALFAWVTGAAVWAGIAAVSPVDGFPHGAALAVLGAVVLTVVVCVVSLARDRRSA